MLLSVGRGGHAGREDDLSARYAFILLVLNAACREPWVSPDPFRWTWVAACTVAALLLLMLLVAAGVFGWVRAGGVERQEAAREALQAAASRVQKRLRRVGDGVRDAARRMLPGAHGYAQADAGCDFDAHDDSYAGKDDIMEDESPCKGGGGGSKGRAGHTSSRAHAMTNPRYDMTALSELGPHPGMQPKPQHALWALYDGCIGELDGSSRSPPSDWSCSTDSQVVCLSVCLSDSQLEHGTQAGGHQACGWEEESGEGDVERGDQLYFEMQPRSKDLPLKKTYIEDTWNCEHQV